MIKGIRASQEMFAIIMLTALKSCFEHDHKHVLRLLQLYEDQALQNTCYGQKPSWNQL